ncbi:putative rRNA maturation factor [Devosia subaequoris]|uniref:Endoribonuclease YbeY n=1 Tax=Devosia subaequoris TaxID=395930 RepID=A0A7W6IMD5_9HYPH|nr:rRNA maturation RNase YbeY [Devosia subaequoris]MBB4052260.1 putative rRNA maturation factor [Devosia subaequoris]MCP1209423.1 rRNA maturation RNase YbeY [Devosia subaequoris]
MTALPPLEIAVIRNADGWPDHFDAIAEQAVLAAIAGARPKITGAAEVSVLLTDDAEQRELNAQWRGKDSATNVLSFPQIEPFAPVTGLLGDITLARETLEREAADLGKSLEHHFTHLMVHGFLHILGYDHINEAEALQMEGLETQILAGLGIDDPYAE